MSAAETPIHQDFAPWYKTVSFSCDEELIRARWEGLLSFIDEVNENEVEALLRLAYGTRQPPEADVVQSFREKFKEADEAFEMSGNDREMQLLAAACLAVIMSTVDAEKAPFAAIAVTTTAFGSGRKADLPMDLKDLGGHEVSRLGEYLRKRPALSIPSTPLIIKPEETIEKFSAQQNWEGVKQGFKDIAQAVTNGIKVPMQRQVSALRKVTSFIEIQDEELKMLWWLVGRYSDSYGCAFEKVPVAARPFTFASELASVTARLPGPPSISGILSRAGLRARKRVVVADLVNSFDQSWVADLVRGNNLSPVSMPLHFALERQLETGPGDAWVAGWAAAVGVGEQYALPELELAELFYRERLLILFS
ncbi:MAG: GTPase-associated system all-helical protein GASH [Alcanivorax jadensis]|uniref:GTPase-associated system all-helical protein GASH n=1 Tax=Alcanivorax jadensis TaxID=64988 RepID=UPI003002C252